LGKTATEIKYKTYRIPCPPCDSIRVDTSEWFRFEREQNEAKVELLNKKVSQLNVTLAKTETKLNYWMIAAIVAIVYTVLGRWLLGWVTKGRFKLP
jgi:hypothetical protein